MVLLRSLFRRWRQLIEASGPSEGGRLGPSLRWLGRGLLFGLAISCWGLGCGPQRGRPDGTRCLLPPCPGSDAGTDRGPTHDRPAPDVPIQDCLVYPNGVPTIGVDMVPHACNNPNWTPGACVDGVTQTKPKLAGLHLCPPNLIRYNESPPTSGTHRGEWGKWGEYSFMPPQRWLHNLEHGGIAFLYHPCAPKSIVEQLRNIARQWPADPQAGPFRWVMTPYPNLPTAVAIVAWGASYTAQCIKADQIKAFVTQYYRKAPEDVASDGSYSELWISR